MAHVGTYPQDLPLGSAGRRASGWWGMLVLIVTEASLFSYLQFSYYYLASQTTHAWPPEGTPPLRLALPNTLILIASSVAAWWGERGIKRGSRGQLLIGLTGALALGVVFVILQVMEWRSKPFSLSSGAYGSLYFTTTGFHMLHVAVGLVIFAALILWGWLGYLSRARHAAVSVGVIYWYFVAVMGLSLFGTYYLTPYLT